MGKRFSAQLTGKGRALVYDNVRRSNYQVSLVRDAGPRFTGGWPHNLPREEGVRALKAAAIAFGKAAGTAKSRHKMAAERHFSDSSNPDSWEKD